MTHGSSQPHTTASRSRGGYLGLFRTLMEKNVNPPLTEFTKYNTQELLVAMCTTVWRKPACRVKSPSRAKSRGETENVTWENSSIPVLSGAHFSYRNDLLPSLAGKRDTYPYEGMNGILPKFPSSKGPTS